MTMDKEPAKSAAEMDAWEATHTGWILLSPVYLSGVEDAELFVMPRWGLDAWHDFNLWVVDQIVNRITGCFSVEAVGYYFWGVKKLTQPKVIFRPANRNQQP